jgi:hypothetical protein
MTDVNAKIESELTVREKLLHKIARAVTEQATAPNIEIAVMTLDFLKGIEDKTEEDMEKIKFQSRVVETLTSEEYEKEMQNCIAENMDSLSTEHLQRFSDELDYMAAINEVQLKMAVGLQEIQDNLNLGFVKTKVTH